MKPDAPEHSSGESPVPEPSEDASGDVAQTIAPDDVDSGGGGEAPASTPWLIEHSGLGFTLTLLAVLLGALAYQAITWPDVRALRAQNPESTAFIERYQERRQPGDPPLRWTWAPYDSISIHAKRAFVAGEDIGFFSHEGFAVEEILVAVSEALLGERGLRGASTITQQVAKNLWLSPSRNPWRKVKEALLTGQLERHLSKWRILEIYLNVAELGEGIYGVEAAAQNYFGVPASQLTERQAAQLAASLPRPGRWQPGVLSGSYERYVAEIEDRLVRAEFLWRRVVPPWERSAQEQQGETRQQPVLGDEDGENDTELDHDNDHDQDQDKDEGSAA